MKTLSDYYAADFPSGVFLPEYPSSTNRRARFVNRERFLIHDPVPPPEDRLVNVLGPHHLLSVWGGALAAAPGVPPPHALTAHWRERLGTGLRMDGKAEGRPYITLFPLEALADAEHAVDPNAHYELLSKEAIPKIDCPQPSAVPRGRYPCMLKISHGYSSLGNYVLRSGDDDDRVSALLAQRWPGARVVRTELIREICDEYCAQFYLSKAGDMDWLGVTGQLFDAGGRWDGAQVHCDLQEVLQRELDPVVRPVAVYLHRHGYAGVVGVDVVRDGAGQLWVVDLNPRINGSTPLLLMSKAMGRRGWSSGWYAPSRRFRGSVGGLLAAARKLSPGEIVVLSYAAEESGRFTACHLAAFGESQADCRELMERLLASGDGEGNSRS
ncbi:MAG: ATP-grasp domain-containing protein [Verrucomicrobiales bacterium]|nr:ATP-grasp domain-containing protein [Verrucomicrobiales bacterium]